MTRELRHGVIVFLAVACLQGLQATQATTPEPLHLRLDNGIEASIYTPEYILHHLVTRRGHALQLVVDGVRYHLIEDPADPAIRSTGDGRFHPMAVDEVIEALESIRHPDLGLQIAVYILPYPRREILESSARDRVMLLSPGVRPVSAYAVHFTVVHEVGHLFQYRWMPDRDRRAWDMYRELRGIRDRGRFHDGAVHRDRPHEIFAEDFRYLYGGDQANYSGSIENAALGLPDAVAGLESFLASLTAPPTRAAVRIFPNPFNPSTRIDVAFDRAPGARVARLRIFDARGRAVRRLFEGRIAGDRLTLPWDGRGDDGRRLPSGTYFARLDYAGSATTTKLTLAR